MKKHGDAQILDAEIAKDAEDKDDKPEVKQNPKD